MVRKTAFFVAICLLSIVVSGRSVLAVETSQTLLVSTELLLISQAKLAYMSINLISNNMEHTVTAVDEDRENLKAVAESLALAQKSVASLADAKDIKENDLKLIGLMSTVNENLKNAANELAAYCDDSKAEHFKTSASLIKSAMSTLKDVTKLLE